MSELTDAELNRLIAEACGWFCDQYKERWWYRAWSPQMNSVDTPPDYCNDLNACREMEKTLDRNKNTIPDDAGFCSEEDAFIGELEWIVAETCAEESIYKRTISATARQRAEAYAKVKGLYE